MAGGGIVRGTAGGDKIRDPVKEQAISLKI